MPTPFPFLQRLNTQLGEYFRPEIPQVKNFDLKSLTPKEAIPSIGRTIKGIMGKYIKSSEGEYFPQRITKLPSQEQNRQLQDFFSQAITGATVSPKLPLTRADIGLARGMSSNIENIRPISMDDVNSIMQVAQQKLDIPEKILNKLMLQQIIAEILGLAQQPRQQIGGLKNLLKRGRR